MIKIFKKHAKTLCLVFSLILFFNIISFAAADPITCSHDKYTFGDKVLTSGVGSYGSYPRYYYQMYFTGNYPTWVRQAVSSWHSSLSSVSLYETEVQANSVIDIANYYTGAGLYGATYFYNGSTLLSHDGAGYLPSNYGWAQIYISISTINASSMPDS